MVVKVQGGWTMDRERFSDHARKVFDIAVNHRRLLVFLPHSTLRGDRFNSDLHVWARIESMFTEGEFMLCPGPKIDAALIDAAQADHWYTFEKRYDDDHYGEYTGEECEVDEDE
jgi:hypothetical protein